MSASAVRLGKQYEHGVGVQQGEAKANDTFLDPHPKRATWRDGREAKNRVGEQPACAILKERTLLSCTYRSKDLLAVAVHVRCHVGDDGGPHKVAVRIAGDLHHTLAYRRHPHGNQTRSAQLVSQRSLVRNEQ